MTRYSTVEMILITTINHQKYTLLYMYIHTFIRYKHVNGHKNAHTQSSRGFLFPIVIRVWSNEYVIR